jgi:hypothetical protein
MSDSFKPESPKIPSHLLSCIATWCDCGKAISGLAGILHCEECGRVWSVSRMEIAQVDHIERVRE